MGLRPLACAIGGFAFVLAACGNPSQPVAEPTVLQQCIVSYPDGSVQVVPDDYCVDHANWSYAGAYYPPTWHYSGSTYKSGSRWYMRGGSNYRPANTIIVVREARYGGSARVQGMTRSYNEGVRKALGTYPTAEPARRGQAIRSADDRRTGFRAGPSGKTQTTATKKTGTGRR